MPSTHQPFNKLLLLLVLVCSCSGPALWTVLAFYNHPTGDDFWYTWMVKRHGWPGAQQEWFITINGRYSSNLFMSFNSLLSGKVWEFKWMPVLLILAWLFTINRVLRFYYRSIIHPFALFVIACFFTSVYFLSLPGLYEGLYWLSGVAGYQLPLIVYLNLAVSPVKTRDYLWLAPSVFIAGGFHEMIALLVSAIAIIYWWYLRYTKKQMTGKVWAIMLVSLLSFVVQVASAGNRYKAGININAAEWSVAKRMSIAFQQTSYHVTIHCLLSPLFWFSLLLVFVLAAYQKNLLPGWNKQQSKRILMLFPVIAIGLVYTPGLLAVHTLSYYAPLRIMNLSWLLCTMACMLYVALLATNFRQAIFTLKLTRFFTRWQFILFLLLFPVAVVTSKNYTLAVKSIGNGDAAIYNREAFERLAKLKEANADTCILQCYTIQPRLLCPTDICQDPTLIGHLEKVFDKKIEVKGATQVFEVP